MAVAIIVAGLIMTYACLRSFKRMDIERGSFMAHPPETHLDSLVDEEVNSLRKIFNIPE